MATKEDEEDDDQEDDHEEEIHEEEIDEEELDEEEIDEEEIDEEEIDEEEIDEDVIPNRAKGPVRDLTKHTHRHNRRRATITDACSRGLPVRGRCYPT